MGQQMTYFAGGQSNEGARSLLFGLGGEHRRSLHAETHQKSRCQQDEGDMPIPAKVAAHFRLIESQSFGRFQVLFNVPTCPNGLHHGGQRGLWWRKDEKVSQLIWIVQTAADDEEMATIHAASLRNGQTRPVEKPLAFGAKAL